LLGNEVTRLSDAKVLGRRVRGKELQDLDTFFFQGLAYAGLLQLYPVLQGSISFLESQISALLGVQVLQEPGGYVTQNLSSSHVTPQCNNGLHMS
jgi:hypothetical protein